ncbi:MAG: tetratricopeptide repeat protein [Thermodesulfobacteriota bacterium]
MGLYLMLSWGVAEVAARWRHRKAVLGPAAAVVLVLLAGAAGRQVRTWQNSITLYEHAIGVTNNNYIAHFNLGNAYDSVAKLNDAIRHYVAALGIEPCSAEAHNNLGLVLGHQGKAEIASEHFYAALRCDPGHNKASNNLGNIMASQGKIEEAFVFYSKALSTDPENAEFHNNVGLVLIRQGKFTQAIHHFQEAVRVDHEYEGASNNLKRTISLKQKVDSALLGLATALASSPEDSMLTEQVSLIKKAKAQLDDVVTLSLKALSFQAGFTPKEFSIDNYADASEVISKYARILPLFEKVIDLEANSPEACYYIACIYALQKKMELACVFIKKAVNGGFDRRDLLENDKNLENIRKTSCFKSLIGEI